MKSKFIFTSLVCVSIYTYSFAQNWQWLKPSSGTQSVLSSDVDAVGNTYSVGEYQSTATFDTKTINSTANESAYFAKHDSSGKIVAFLNIHPMFKKVKSDALGNVLFSGSDYYTSDANLNAAFIGTDTLRDTSLTTYVLIAKFDKAMKPIWKIHYTPNSVINTREMFTDASNNIYLILESNSYQLEIGGKTYTGNKGLMKINSEGTILYYKNLPGSMENIYGQTDSNGNVYLTSLFNGNNKSVTIDNVTATNINPKFGSNYYDIITMKLNDTSAAVWVNLSNNALANTISSLLGPNGITVDSKGNVIVYGDFNDNIVFGQETLTNTVRDKYTINPFIVKYNTEGSLQWSKTIAQNTEPDFQFLKIVAGPNDLLYVYGASSYDGGYLNTFHFPKIGSSGSSDRFVACFDTDLVNKWYRYVKNGETNNTNGSIGVSSNGDMFLASTASFFGQVQLGDIDTTNTMFVLSNSLSASTGSYIAKFNAGGSALAVEYTSEDNIVSVFPNPVSSKFKVKIGNSIIKEITIYNLQGEAIYSKLNPSKLSTYSVELSSSLPSGVYFMKLTTNEQTINRKIVLKK